VLKSPFGLRGEGGEVERNRVKLTENKLILGHFYSTLLYPTPPSPSIQMDYKSLKNKNFLMKIIVEKSLMKILGRH